MTWFFRGGKKYLVLVFGSKLTCFCVEASKVTPFYSDDGIGLISIVASKSSRFLRGGSKLTECGPKLTCFECDGRLIRFLCGWLSKLTRFSNVGRKSLGFSVGIEVDFVVWVVDCDLISV